MASTVHLDGTTLEGGGQLLRIAVGLSSLTGTPLAITKIRQKRKGGTGMKAQHLAAVKWLKDAAMAIATGDKKGSECLQFTPYAPSMPEKLPPNVINIGTQGSVGLVFQAVLPHVLFSGRMDPSKPFIITIKGGTNVSMSPSIDYIQEVLLPTLAVIGVPPIKVEIKERGWMHRRQNQLGHVVFNITPLERRQKLDAFSLKDRGNIESIKAKIIVPQMYREHTEKEVFQVLSARFPVVGRDSVVIDFENSGHQSAVYLLLVVTTTNGFKIGRDYLYSGKTVDSLDTTITNLVEKTASDLAAEIEHGGCVDEHMRDQLVVFQALADGTSFVDVGRDQEGRWKQPSLHTQTAQWVASQIVKAEFSNDGSGECRGVGFATGDQDISPPR